MGSDRSPTSSAAHSSRVRSEVPVEISRQSVLVPHAAKRTLIGGDMERRGFIVGTAGALIGAAPAPTSTEADEGAALRQAVENYYSVS